MTGAPITGDRKHSAGRLTPARIAAGAAVVIAAVVAALLLFGGGDSYTVKFRFLNAGQLVKGNLVQVAGAPAGKVTDFAITDDGEAEVEVEIDEEYAPLHRGTRALDAADRPVVHRRPLHRVDAARRPWTRGGAIPDGGTIGADHTTAAVELDQFFNVFDKRTRRSLQGFFKGQNRQYAGRGEEANRGLTYLSPSLSSSSRLFRELTYDRARARALPGRELRLRHLASRSA